MLYQFQKLWEVIGLWHQTFCLFVQPPILLNNATWTEKKDSKKMFLVTWLVLKLIKIYLQ